MLLTSNSSISVVGDESALGQQNSTCIFVDSSAERISKLFVFCFILLGSFFGNVFIIIIVYRHRDLRKTINYFIVNMAQSDLVFPLILLPVRITELVTDSGQWRVSGTLGLSFCNLFYFASLESPLVSAESLMWISIDRFVAVFFPMKLGLISSKIRSIAIISTWICAGLVNFPSLISSKVVVRGNDTACVETNMESFLFDKKANVTYLWLQFSLFIIAPLLLITAFLHCDSNNVHTHSSYCKLFLNAKGKSFLIFSKGLSLGRFYPDECRRMTMWKRNRFYDFC